DAATKSVSTTVTPTLRGKTEADDAGDARLPSPSGPPAVTNLNSPDAAVTGMWGVIHSGEPARAGVADSLDGSTNADLESQRADRNRSGRPTRAKRETMSLPL